MNKTIERSTERDRKLIKTALSMVDKGKSQKIQYLYDCCSSTSTFEELLAIEKTGARQRLDNFLNKTEVASPRDYLYFGHYCARFADYKLINKVANLIPDDYHNKDNIYSWIAYEWQRNLNNNSNYPVVFEKMKMDYILGNLGIKNATIRTTLNNIFGL